MDLARNPSVLLDLLLERFKYGTDVFQQPAWSLDCNICIYTKEFGLRALYTYTLNTAIRITHPDEWSHTWLTRQGEGGGDSFNLNYYVYFPVEERETYFWKKKINTVYLHLGCLQVKCCTTNQLPALRFLAQAGILSPQVCSLSKQCIQNIIFNIATIQ